HTKCPHFVNCFCDILCVRYYKLEDGGQGEKLTPLTKEPMSKRDAYVNPNEYHGRTKSGAFAKL
ncbi:hypothetical protein KKC_09327, partial [Listeria fleischmannii subsp. coloradonensis]|uniref:hypothetical protein n=1 Tax=Listeria fleischmannii TaxID=1069827 RepID=UPI000254F77D